MTIDYLDGKTWAEISREERFFCLVLYTHIEKNPSEFVGFLVEKGVALEPDQEWQVGYEACFYRDVLKQKGRDVSATPYSNKRTFDLALFGTEQIVVIEAKAQQGFKTTQTSTFAQDRKDIREVLECDIPVAVVALASSTYFENERKYGKAGVLKIFDGLISWKDLHQLYKDPVFEHADQVYRN